MGFSLALDHLAVVAKTIEEGSAYVEAVLGVTLSPGGKHPYMGTHNRLLSLGPDMYLEVIAIDPDAPKPPHRRWFNLDSYDGAPRMMNWVARTDDIHTALESAPPGSGRAVSQSRGDISWIMAVSEFGRLPYDGAMPALIEWSGQAHPSARLPDVDCRLARLDVFHPKAAELLEVFPELFRMGHVAVKEGPEKRLIATIGTPDGNRILA